MTTAAVILGIVQDVHTQSTVVTTVGSPGEPGSVFGKIGPFEIAVALITLANALWTTYFSFLQRAKVKVHGAEQMGIVVVPSEQAKGIHIRCSLVNEGVRMGTIQHLEAVFRAADGQETTFGWHLFFRYQDGGAELIKD